MCENLSKTKETNIKQRDHCLSVTTAMIKHRDQSNFVTGGKGLFGLQFHIIIHHHRKSRQKLKQGNNLEAASDTEAMEG